MSYDGQSFNIDGRRIWLVSGAIHYARTPHQLWRRRIRAAKEAGLNCIETYVFWNLHEPSPGVFNFAGDADLRKFVQTVAQEGLYCILRPGPYICAEWDFGGLPAWLHRVEGMKLRQANGPFLEACARYLGAVFEQVKDLQVNDNPARTNNGPASGPIVMVQAENEWISHNPDQAEPYLGEIVRYLRESGCTVPINVCNNLWQRVPGTIDTWNANQHLANDLRQLRVVQANAPRMVTEFWPGWFDAWGSPHHRDYTGDWNLYRLAQILGVGAQYNLFMFHGGTNFGFFGGRTIASPDCFMTTSYDYDAPLSEAGGRGPKYLAIKRISTFASQFGHVFASLSPGTPPAAIAPTDDDHPLTLLHQTGSQGDVLFLLKSKNDKTTATRVLLPNGLSLPVPLGEDRVAWVALDVKLPGTAKLSYTNLRPWAFVGRKMLVLFGPAGAEGLVAINDAPLTLRVPEGQAPLVEQHEDMTIVVLNGEQVDAAYLLPAGLVVGAAGLDEQDRPLPLDGWPTTYTIALDGKVAKSGTKPAKPPVAPKLGKWSHAPLTTYLAGSAPAFKTIDGPRSLEQLHCDYGYGWYRFAYESAAPAAGKAFAPGSGDRLHLFADGKPSALLGLGPGAEYDPTAIKLGKTNVVLADNLGRFNFGWAVGESKGLLGHLLSVKPIKLGKPDVVADKAPDPFTLTGFVLYARRGDRPPADHLLFKFALAGKPRGPVVLDIQGLPAKAMLFLNDQPLGLYDRHFSAGAARFVIQPGEPLKNGKNVLRVALFHKLDVKTDVLKHITLYETSANLTASAGWAFAPWTVPAADEFEPLTRSTASGLPAWYRATFPAIPAASVAVPLWLEPIGLTKGQLYLNGHNLGRYFVATAAGKAVPPQERYYLPEPWLNTDRPNELVIFEEHGKHPGKARLVFDPMGPYGG